MVEGEEVGMYGLPSVSVVIPTHNRASRLRETLQPLLDDPATSEVIVIDDGSTDATASTLRDVASSAPKLRVLRLTNGGAARARQAGLEVASGEIVLVMDDDVVAMPGLARGHALRHLGRPHTVVVGYMPTERPRTWVRGTFPTTIYADSYEQHCAEWELDPSTILDRLWMGNVSFTRADALGVGMCGTVNGYHADRDLGLRCMRAGLTALFDRQLLATHRHERNIRQYRADARSQGASSWALHVAHHDLIGPYDPNRHSNGRASRWLVAGAERRWLGALLAQSCTLGVHLAGHLGARNAELRGAYLLNRIEAARGGTSERNDQSVRSLLDRAG